MLKNNDCDLTHETMEFLIALVEKKSNEIVSHMNQWTKKYLPPKQDQNYAMQGELKDWKEKHAKAQ